MAHGKKKLARAREAATFYETFAEALLDQIDELGEQLDQQAQTIHEYRATVEVLEGIAAELHNGWQNTSVAADHLLAYIAQLQDEVGFATLYRDNAHVEILAETIYAEPEDVEEPEVTIEDALMAAAAGRLTRDEFNALLTEEYDDSHAFAWSPDFDADGVEELQAGDQVESGADVRPN